MALQFDPSLFVRKSLIVIIYVDDILIYGKSDMEINDLIERLKRDEIALHCKGTAEGYLGVDIQQDENQIILLQEGLAKQIITALGLDSKYTIPVNIPADVAVLCWDVGGKEARGSINYACVVGMLLHLGHSWPDISFATHQCAQYTHSPKRTHENALKQFGRYLKGTIKNGLILNPSSTFKIDCYPDADFVGLWTQDNKHKPHCMRSCTGYVLYLSQLSFPMEKKTADRDCFIKDGNRICGS
jgi:hypothetical protein